MSLVTTRITDAIEFALRAHDGQMRKDNRPYIIHPLTVGYILQNAGYSEDVVIAGMLHDVVEDTVYTAEDIQELFGERVAQLVLGVTEDKTIRDWMERNNAYIENLKNTDDETMAISAADVLDNRQSILWNLEKGNDIWKSFKASPKEIMEMTEKKMAVIRHLDNEIIHRLEEVTAKLWQMIK